jgi:hypothetical protein
MAMVRRRRKATFRRIGHSLVYAKSMVRPDTVTHAHTHVHAEEAFCFNREGWKHVSAPMFSGVSFCNIVANTFVLLFCYFLATQPSPIWPYSLMITPPPQPAVPAADGHF